MSESSQQPSAATHPLRDRRILSWAMYDWANSAYTTLMITVAVAYIQRVVFPEDTWGTTGAVVWAWGISLSMLLGAILSPIVGAIADANGSKRRWLGFTALTGSAACVLWGLTPTEQYVIIVVLFVTANVMLELSLGVYNGFLPEIARPEQFNSASAWGYGLGYIGGGLALVIAILLLQFGTHIGLESAPIQLRAGLVLMGAWWGLFTLPALFVLRDPVPADDQITDARQSIRRAGIDVVQTLRGLKTRIPLALFLLSFLFYNDGVQTVISQASTFALQELQFPESELMMVILMIQFLAWPGSLITAKCADVFGQKPTLLVTLGIWISVLLAALLVHNRVGFWSMAVVIALVLGGVQSVSRSLMASMIPDGENAKYFGFFNLSGKATSFLGTFLFGALVAATGSSRVAVVGLIPLFAIGALLLVFVRVPRRLSKSDDETDGVD